MLSKYLILIILVLTTHFAQAQNEFITRWDLSIDGPGDEISFDVETSGTVNYTWEEVSPGSASGSGTFSDPTATISGLPSGAVIRLRIEPANLTRVSMGYQFRLLDVEQWGSVQWSSMAYAFNGCSNLQISASDIPDLSLVSNMEFMFSVATSFNSNIGNWNTASVTNMNSMFQGAKAFNQAIGNWNTALVTDMNNMFRGATDFNQDIGNWNTESVGNMRSMFSGATAFNHNIGNWNTALVTDMSFMFNGAASFNQAIGNWNTESVTTMGSMFRGATAFDQAIGNWNTESVTSMNNMFRSATSFNKAIGNWNTALVNNMNVMFFGATSFNQAIGDWNTESVEGMNSMFNAATAFNQNIGNWNTASVTDMSYMFNGATAFNQNIGNWNTALVTDMSFMFNGATSFNQAIGNWNTESVTTMGSMFRAALAFNQAIGNWKTASVTSMRSMFSGATAFNQAIGNWNTALVMNMSFMFNGASSFNQAIGNWTLNPDVEMDAMLDNSGMDCSSYSNTLIGWQANNPAVIGRSLGAVGREYGPNAVAARTALNTTQGWTISDDIQVAGNTWYLDADNDNYFTGAGVTQCGSPGAAYKTTGLIGGNDCNDNNAALNPGATEICGNGIDDNCNGQIDENCVVCGNGTGLLTTKISSSRATLNWTAINNPAQWQVRYKTTKSGSKWVEVPAFAGTARSVVISGLSANQDYTWQLRARCENVWTVYSSPISFRTLAATGPKSSEVTNVDPANSTLRLYPNPSNGMFLVELQVAEKINAHAKIQILDIAGRVLQTETAWMSGGSIKQSVNASTAMSYGMYMVSVIVNNKTYITRLVYRK